MNRPLPRLAFAGALLLLAAQSCYAQYSWIDTNGTRVFSDRPPPPGTPANRILKAPRRLDALPQDAVQATPAAGKETASVPADKPKQPSLAEREADYRKRQAQRQDEEKKGQDEAANQAAQREMCASARQEEAELASGMRITEVRPNGERGYVSDEDRARRLARARQALAQCR